MQKGTSWQRGPGVPWGLQGLGAPSCVFATFHSGVTSCHFVLPHLASLKPDGTVSAWWQGRVPVGAGPGDKVPGLGGQQAWT